MKPVLLYLPALDEALATNAPVILSLKRGISRKLNLPLVDLTQAVQAGGKALYLEADPVHFNQAGNEAIARRLLDILSPPAAR